MSLDPERLPDGRILVPMRAERGEPGRRGYTLGDGMVPIGPEHEDYAAWDAYMRAVEEQDAADERLAARLKAAADREDEEDRRRGE
jgi:hypothetical protein